MKKNTIISSNFNNSKKLVELTDNTCILRSKALYLQENNSCDKGPSLIVSCDNNNLLSISRLSIKIN